MNKKWMYVMGAACLLAACRPAAEKGDGTLAVIDAAAAYEQQTELKVSDLGQHVRYVPLETTDSCLVGNNPKIMVLEKQLVVLTNQTAYCFDKESGRFLNAIGHTGEDPQGYSTNEPAYNPRNGLFYFARHPDQLQRYDAQGRYQGKVKVETPPNLPTSFAFLDTLIVGHYNNLAQMNKHNRALGFFTESGLLTDTIESTLPPLPPMDISDIASISVHKLGNAGTIHTQFKDGSTSFSILGGTSLWEEDGRMRFKEPFNDTIYNVSTTDGLTPWAVFSLGKYGLEAKARWSNEELDGKLLPVFMLESPRAVFFQCFEGLKKTMNGIYDKQAGTTRMCDEEKGLTDDVNHFLPFRPSACSAQGEYAQLVEAADVVDFLDENPEAKGNSALAPLLEVDEEDNPVVVLVE